MDRLRVAVRGRLEIIFAEHLQHCGVLRQNFRDQFVTSGIARDLDQVVHQDRTDPAPLQVIGRR